MERSDNVGDPDPDPRRVRPRRDPVDAGSSHFGPLDRLKSFLLTLWYLITGKYNL